ncbi:MAG: hypothetical protein M3380_01005 [Chloroflexota bacterium]|nr:hypothetical protein [Chloroflexota bacterium]
MELALALIVFAILIAAWFVLPGTAATVVVEETPALLPDGLQIATAEA